jgi:hypothetical protein
MQSNSSQLVGLAFPRTASTAQVSIKFTLELRFLKTLGVRHSNQLYNARSIPFAGSGCIKPRSQLAGLAANSHFESSDVL